MHFKCLLFGLCVLLAMTTAADPLEDFFEEQWENFKVYIRVLARHAFWLITLICVIKLF